MPVIKNKNQNSSWIESLLYAYSSYCIVGKFGGGKIRKFILFEHLVKRFGKLIDQPKDSYVSTDLI